MPTDYVIKNGRTVFDATLYTGTSAAQNITNQYGFKPDLVWTKSRNNITDHGLCDSVRGVSTYVASNTAGTESSAANNYVTAFNSNGFGVNQGSISGYSGYTYVGWQWQAGQGTTSTNTDGTISSTVSVNQTAGFSIVTYTGNGTNGATVGHGLGAIPSFVIVKGRSYGTDGNVKHINLASNNVLLLDDNSGQVTPGSGYVGNLTSASTISLQNGGAAITNVNNNGSTYVAYCWTPIAGFSSFGIYYGNGSANGPFIYLGFRPKYIMIKRIDSSAGRWDISDTSRNPYNYVTQWLYANYSDAEDNAGELYDFLSNGFKLRNTGSGTNASGGSYVYMAWAENPFKYANAR